MLIRVSIVRLSVLTYLEPLDREALRNILTEPKNAIIKQYQKLFEMDGVTLTFDTKALDFIVDKAVEFKLGARGLRSITESIMMDAMYTTPSSDKKTLRVTLKMAEKQLSNFSKHRLKVA